MFRRAGFLFIVIASLGFAYDLDSVKNEPNLEKRSELALSNAETELQAAKDAYQKGDEAKAQAASTELAESVELAYSWLIESGKDPRRSPKFFKKAELSTRQLLRRLEGVIDALSLEDRAALESARARISNVHDNLILAIMGRKK
jgi:hypothetical protein